MACVNKYLFFVFQEPRFITLTSACEDKEDLNNFDSEELCYLTQKGIASPFPFIFSSILAWLHGLLYKLLAKGRSYKLLVLFTPAGSSLWLATFCNPSELFGL